MVALTDKEALASGLSSLVEIEEVIKQRGMAQEAFEKLEYPTLKHEEWKYTSIKPILERDYLVGSTKTTHAKPNAINDLHAVHLLMINGRLDRIEGRENLAEGILICSIEEAFRSHAGLVSEYFARQQEKAFGDVFQAMNTAFASTGFFIYVPKGKVVTSPVLIDHVFDTESGNTLSLPRNLIIVGENAHLEVIEQYTLSGTHTHFTNSFTESSIAKYGRLEHVRIQDNPLNAYHISNIQVTQEANSSYANTLVTLSGGLVRNNLDIELRGEHCEAFMNGLYMLAKSDHVDNHTSVDHQFPNCYSNQLYKGILDGKAKAVFNGKIYVREGAQKTNAFQSNKNVLISPDAVVDTKPQLEIWADDVKCSHGCTVGALDEEPMFYLRSRGLNEREARGLLLRAFAADVLSRIKSEVLKAHIETLIDQRLAD